jgi:hypothetical protein
MSGPIKTIKQQHDVGIWLQITAELDRGQAVINMRPDDGASDGTILTAREARTLSRALLSYAARADRANARKAGAK